jgi:hypothetical protein
MHYRNDRSVVSTYAINMICRDFMAQGKLPDVPFVKMADLAAEVRPNLDELLQPYKDAVRTFKLELEDLWQKSQLEESDFQNPLQLAKTLVDPQIWPLVSRYESVAYDAADDDAALFSVEGEINQAIESLRLSLMPFTRKLKKSLWDWVHESKDPKVTRALDLYTEAKQAYKNEARRMSTGLLHNARRKAHKEKVAESQLAPIVYANGDAETSTPSNLSDLLKTDSREPDVAPRVLLQHLLPPEKEISVQLRADTTYSDPTVSDKRVKSMSKIVVGERLCPPTCEAQGCGFNVTSLAEYAAHRKKAHPGVANGKKIETVFICSECHREYPSYDNLTSHIAKVHLLQYTRCGV